MVPHGQRPVLVLFSSFAVAALSAAPALVRDDPSANVTEPPPFDQFLVIPLRVHVLTSDSLPEIDCALSDADVERILGKVNRVWHPAGIHFGLESLVREPAVNEDGFVELRDLSGGRPPLPTYRMLLPEKSRDGSVPLHVYYLHAFAVNGVYLGNGVALVQATARLREVEGGIDEPLPRVTAHELGHALGLPHRQDRTNLLASGTTGTLLNVEEVSRARRRAAERLGALTVDEVREKAEAAEDGGRYEEACRLRRWLGEIPGCDIGRGQPSLAVDGLAPGGGDHRPQSLLVDGVSEELH